MSVIIIKYIVDGVEELVQTWNEVDTLPEVDNVAKGFIDIVGEQPTREERRS